MLKQIQDIYDFIKKWFWAIPIWKRSIITSLIGAFGGSTIIGFFNQYALYYYAICQGFRLPIEGVQYLDLSIGILSFMFLLISLLGTYLCYKSIKLFGELSVKFLKIEKKKLAYISVFLLSILIFYFWLLSLTIIFRKFFPPIIVEIIQNESYYLFLLIGLFLGFGSRISKNENLRRAITLWLVIIGMGIAILMLFDQTIYNSFLKTIQYGGGISIGIEYRKADNTEATTKGSLLLRSNNSVFIRRNGNVEEIPSNRISKLIFYKDI